MDGPLGEIQGFVRPRLMSSKVAFPMLGGTMVTVVAVVVVMLQGTVRHGQVRYGAGVLAVPVTVAGGVLAFTAFGASPGIATFR